MQKLTTPPPWLDLDGLAAPGLRSDMAQLTGELREVAARIQEIGPRYRALTRAADDQLPDEPLNGQDGNYAAFAHLTGQAQMDDAMSLLLDLVASVADVPVGTCPTWLAAVGG